MHTRQLSSRHSEVRFNKFVPRTPRIPGLLRLLRLLGFLVTVTVVMAMVAMIAVIAMIMVFVAARADVMVLTLARIVMGDLFRRVMFLIAFG